MEKRALLAIVLSLGVILFFNYLYMKLFSSSKYENIRSYKEFQVQKIEKEEVSKDLLKDQKSSEIKEKYKILEEGSQIYWINSPKYTATLSSLGVRFETFTLKNYAKKRGEKEEINLVSGAPESLPLEIYLESSPEVAIINYQGPEKTNYIFEKGDTEYLVFRTTFKELLLEKKLIFKKDSYFIDMNFKVLNLGKVPVKDRVLLRGAFSPFADGTKYVFKGPFYYTNHLNEVKIKNELEEYSGFLKYLGYEDTYFIVALIPDNLGNINYRATFRNLNKNLQEFILWLPPFELAPQQEITYKFKVYMGPKKIEEMKKEYPLLGKALYFGIFDFIAKPLLYTLKFIHKFTGNFGWDIIFITIVLRIFFFPLNHMSYKSMKKMQEIQPIIQKLREKYKDDPQTLNKELMNIYKTYKINPFSGCLPILIQIPIFIAMYKVLLMAIELRHAPFWLWISDLSAPERFYGIPLLTILMGVSMFVQQKLSPPSTDPLQNKIMLLLPLIFIILFMNFPSGLVLYWFVNNILSIIQQIFTLRLAKK